MSYGYEREIFAWEISFIEFSQKMWKQKGILSIE